MNTKYIALKSIIRNSTLLLVILFSTARLTAQVTAVGQVWQWSIPVQGSNVGGGSRAYLWVPPGCTHVRGIVLGQNNMQEFSILENQPFRDSMASINFGVVWVSPAFDLMYNIQEGARTVFLQIMVDLANESGYGELANVPCVPIGHSAASNFPFAFAAGTPERTLCGVSEDGTFPYDFGNLFAANTQCGRTSDYIPQLATIGEFEGAGDASTNFTKVFDRRSAHPLTPMSMLPRAGEYHFATSQRTTNFIAYYIKKVAQYRLAVDATATALATLTPINPTTSGWLVDRWRKDELPRYPRAPVGSYTGTKALTGSAGEENFWCFDADMAARIEDYENTFYRKTPTLIMYNQNPTGGVVGPQVPQNNNHVQCHLNFYPLNDSLDFELSSSFADTIPLMSGRCVGWMSTTNPTTGVVTNGVVGAPVGHPADNSLSVIDREIGPISKLRKNATTGITTFRMTMERGLNNTFTNYVTTAIVSVAHPGDATYKASVLQAEVGMAVTNTTGVAQTITFNQLPNVPNTTASVPLAATSSIGMPVQYFVREGPAQLVGSSLVLTAIPPSARYPVKVTVVAWQWGRDAGLAANTTGTASPLAGQLIQTATPVENTFYITQTALPVDLIDFTATLVNNHDVNLKWQTATEINSKAFDVQKSMDAVNWSSIGTVPAKGKASTYTLDDLSPQPGINYYRLKEINKDSSFVYSKTASVYISNDDIGITVTRAGYQVTTTGGKANDMLSVTMYNSIGQSMFNDDQRIPASRTVVTNLPRLQTGIYMVTVRTGNFVKTLKVFIN